MKEFLVPTEGLTVINPETNLPLPADGAEVTMTTYWRRRIQDGEVAVGKPSKKSK